MPDSLPDILFSGGTAAETKRIGRMAKGGHIRKVLQGVYTSDLQGQNTDFIRRHWQAIVAHTYPGALLSHRSAMEFQPSPAGFLYLTHSFDRVVRWPGLTLKFTKGPSAGADDRALFGALHIASEERALLENLRHARVSESERRTLEQEQVEARILRILDARGEAHLNSLRDTARVRATELGLQDEFARLDRIIGALLATRDAKGLASPVAKAHAMGEPYDALRIDLLDKLIVALNKHVFAIRPERTLTTSAFRDLAFFEGYFSNYIEGTEFEVQEAADIIFRHVVIPNRAGDSHDIRGTFALCSDRSEMQRVPSNGNEFIELLRSRHAVLLEGRPEKLPGVFKERSNRAGDTHFVEPRMVRGTLKEGYERMAMLADPVARALYMMFLVSEVHPFNDGTGRTARLMMNAELAHTRQTKIIIPTVLREDYLLALRRSSRQHDPLPFIRMMERAHAWSHWLEPSSYDTLHAQMLESNAYKEPDVATLRWPE